MKISRLSAFTKIHQHSIKEHDRVKELKPQIVYATDHLQGLKVHLKALLVRTRPPRRQPDLLRSPAQATPGIDGDGGPASGAFELDCTVSRRWKWRKLD